MKVWMSELCRGAVVATAITATGVAGSVAFNRAGTSPDLALPTRSSTATGLVSLDAPEGMKLLFESEAHTAFVPLVSFFETQRSLTYCGVASIAMVLNALGVPAPMAMAYGSHRMFTQDNVLDERTDAVVSSEAIARRGMSLADVAGVLAVYGTTVEIHYGDESSVGAFRERAIDYLAAPGHYVIVNYSRVALGQEGPGHISPLGAYDADSDRFLILDVSRYKTPAVWVPARQLFRAMAEPIGPDHARTRGFLLIRAAGDNPRNGGTSR